MSSVIDQVRSQSSSSVLVVGSITMGTVLTHQSRSTPLSVQAGNVPSVKYVRLAGRSIYRLQ